MRRFLLLALLAAPSLAFSQTYQERLGDEEFAAFAYPAAIKHYLKALDHDPADRVRVKLADSYRMLHQPEQTVSWYEQVADFDSQKPIHHYYYAEALMATGQKKKAQDWYARYQQEAESDPRAGEKLDVLARLNTLMSDSSRYVISPLPFNSSAADFSPVYYQSGLAFVSGRGSGALQPKFRWDNTHFLDIYTIDSTDGFGDEPIKAPGKVNTKFHEGPLAFNQDFSRVIFTRNDFESGHLGSSEQGITKLKLYEATRVDDKWTGVKEISFDSPEYSVGHPTTNPEFNLLIFSSDMPGGMGGTDLYLSRWTGSEWGEPLNLGTPVNTPGNEQFPFLHSDGMLYFASDGHGGLGGLDIYSAEAKAPGEFTNVKDLGYPINTASDDFGLILDGEKVFGFLSSNREGGSGSDDIYQLRILPPQKIRLTGIVRDQKSKELLPLSTVTLMEADSTVIEQVAADSLAAFAFDLEPKKVYLLRAGKEDYRTVHQDLSTGDVELGETIERVLELGKPEDYPGVVVVDNNQPGGRQLLILGERNLYEYRVKAGKTQVLDGDSVWLEGPAVDTTIHPEALAAFLETKGIMVDSLILLTSIYYDYDKSDIRPDAAATLDQLLALLELRPEVKLQLEAHTDSRGGNSYNDRLADRRVKAARKYLISKGLSAKRIVAVKSFGEGKLVNGCADEVECSDPQHQANRRTEVRLLLK